MRHKKMLVAVLMSLYLLGSRTLLAQHADNGKFILGPISGTVVDPAGGPAAGSEVVLIGQKQDADPVVLAKAVTDSQGRFRIESHEGDYTRYAAGLAAVVSDAKGWIGGAPVVIAAKPTDVLEVRIQLLEVQEYRGRLVDSHGKPVVGADVKLTRWSDGGVWGDGDQAFPFSADMIRQCRGRSAEDGSFALQGVPSRGSVTARITAEGFGSPDASFTLARSVTIQLVRAGSVRGSIAIEGADGDLSGIELRIESLPATEPKQGDAWRAYYDARTATDARGAFHWEGVPAGMAQIQLDDKVPYTTAARTIVEVKSGEESVVSMPMQRAIAVRGKVVNKETGRGVPGVRLTFYSFDQDGESYWRYTTTDDQGAYTAHVKPGSVWCPLPEVPDGYANPSWQEPHDRVKVTQDTTWPTIELEPASVVEGTVVDKTGTPVAGAEIRIQSAEKSDTSPFFLDNSFTFKAVFADAAGKFTIEGAREKQQLNVRARTKTAVSEPVDITVGESPSPIRLVVDGTKSFTLRGTVVDDTGRPLPGVDVCPDVDLWFGNAAKGWVVRYRATPVTVQTDAEGKFEIGGLWAGDKYDIRIDARGCKTFGSKKIAGTPGGVHDFGQIVLVGTNLVVEGRIVDSAGEPVTDVRVFNNGDGPEPIKTHSDAAGMFRLEGFSRGPVYVFADKEGWRFTGLRVNAGAQDVVLTMLRAGEPVPQAPAPAAPDAAEEQRAARELLELLWEKSSSEGARRRRILIKLAKIDRQTAYQRAQENNIDLDKPLDRDRLRGIAVENLDAALGLIANQPSRGYYSLKDLAHLFAVSAPEKATRCVEAAVLQARSLDQPHRATGLAEMGALAARLGNEEGGRKLVLEAAEMAAQWTPSAQFDFARGTVAAALARFDLPRALTLLENVGGNWRDRGLANVAASLDDIQQAASLLKEVESEYARQARLRLAYRIAATRPAEAVALIEKATGETAPGETAPAERGYGMDDDTRAIAFGWLATQIARSDPTLAHRLIDRAFATYLLPGDPADRFRGQRAIQPALLAVQAQQAGYPDMESVVWRVLATRVTTPPGASPAAAQESQVVTAFWLALVDRSAARQILAAVEPNSDVIGASDIVQGRRDWLRAWALVDPPHAVELARRDLDAAKDDSAKRVALRAIEDMIDLWTTPADNRFSYLITPYKDISPLQEY